MDEVLKTVQQNSPISSPQLTRNKFSPKKVKIILFSFATILFLVAFITGGLFLGKNKHSENQNNPLFNNLQVSGLSEAEKEGKSLSGNNCVGTEKRKLATLPMKMEDFSMIIPYGLVVGDHVTPIDHQYFSPTIFNSPRDTYEVMAMADANLVEIQPRVKPEYTEYRMVFTISCTLFYYYDLVTSLSPDIKTQFDKASGSFSKQMNIPVKAGQVIGRIGGQTLDFAVWDMDVILKGFVVPENYKGESWKIHTVDPLDYYTEDLKKLALSKYIRTVPPVSGKIDYDIDGKLVGNWFVKNTNGYEGIRKNNNPQGYSRTHLAIVPNHIDPTFYMISFGNFGGEFRQFGTSKDSLDPTDMDVKTGLVKYDLFDVQYTKENGEQWNGMSFDKNIKTFSGNTSRGCVIFQLQSARSLKMEAFPNINCQSASGFSNKAIIYER
ncbi:MAG: hypothetical protein ACD_37C00088G0006 [uncultured bacterium]|nr:MAG: hypothetical protein ACD_37C00088G0006 [uncultured bacterium]